MITDKLRNVQRDGCGAIRLNAAVTGEPWMKCHRKGCTACFDEVCRELADAIEREQTGSKSTPLPEGIEWPQYEDGGFVMIGDEISHIGGSKYVNAVAFKRDDAFIIDERWKEFRFLPPFERYKPDTQEAIDEDMALGSYDYLKKHGLILVKADGETKKEFKQRVRIAHRQHILMRQRKLLGGE